MAMEFVKKEYEKAHKEIDEKFENGILVGVKLPNGSIRYIFPYDLETLKTELSMKESSYLKNNLIYVGKVKLQKTEEGLVPDLEEVDLSELEIKVIKIPEKLKKEKSS